MERKVLHTSYENQVTVRKTIENGKYVLALFNITGFDAEAEKVELVGLDKINMLRDFINEHFPDRR